MRSHFILALVLAGSCAVAGEPAGLTLEGAVARALQSAPQIAASQAMVDSTQSLAVSAGRLPDPSLVVGVDNLPINGPDAFSANRDFMTMKKIGVMQTFPRTEKRRLQRERASADEDVAIAELAQSRSRVARSTAQAWVRVASATSTLDALRGLREEIRAGADAARAGLAAGKTSSGDAIAAEMAVARFDNRLLQLEGERQAAWAELGQWIADNAVEPLGSLPSFDRLPAPIETLLQSAHLHADVVPYEARLFSARTDVALARAEKKPDWSVELAYAKRGAPYSDMASLQFTIGLPLFSRSRKEPVVSARASDVARIEAEREAQVRMHTAELRQQIIEWRQATAQLKRFDADLLPLAKARTQLSLAAYRGGTGELRSSLDAFADEADLLIEQLALENRRGTAWAFLRYLEAEPLHAQAGEAP